MTAYAYEQWIDDPAVAEIEYSDYWNDEAAERDKPWWILDGDFGKLERYLEEVGLRADLQTAIEVAERETGKPLSGTGIDLAAGTLWAAPLLLRQEGVERLYCLEYSHHRLMTIGPRMLEHYEVPEERVVLVYGSFYEIGLPDSSLDFALLAQAFHHADRPGALLAEVRRVLRPGGVLLIVGEHRIRPRHHLVHTAKVGLSFAPAALQERLAGRPVEVRRTLRPTAAELEPPDPLLGDHVYKRSDYAAMFEAHGFRWKPFHRSGGEYQGFVLW